MTTFTIDNLIERTKKTINYHELLEESMVDFLEELNNTSDPYQICDCTGIKYDVFDGWYTHNNWVQEDGSDEMKQIFSDLFKIMKVKYMACYNSEKHKLRDFLINDIDMIFYNANFNKLTKKEVQYFSFIVEEYSQDNFDCFREEWIPLIRKIKNLTIKNN